MVELDCSRLGREVASLLTMRGGLVPPLRWCDDPCEAARTQLSGMSDKSLFAPHEPRERGTLAAVRAMLYLWNGCLREVEAPVQEASARSQSYILGLMLLHQGRYADAKRHLQKLGGHQCHNRLLAGSLDLLRNANSPAIKPFEELLTSKATWEPMAFVDLHEQAVAGQLDRPSELVVRKIQVEEFNLLFVDCYRKATGQDPTVQREVRESPARKRREQQSATHRDTGATQGARTPPSSGGHRPKSPMNDKVRMACPKCRHITTVDASQRGKAAKCAKCGAGFKVPGADGAASSAARVRVACPKCRTTAAYDDSLRGRKVRCKQCGAAMLLPKSKSAA